MRLTRKVALALALVLSTTVMAGVAPAQAGHEWYQSGCDSHVWWTPGHASGSGVYGWWHDHWPYESEGWYTFPGRHSGIDDQWAAMGWECSRYGLPVGATTYWGDGWYYRQFNCGVMWRNTWQGSWFHDYSNGCLWPR